MFPVLLNGLAMRLRPSEVASVAEGLFDGSPGGDLTLLAEALGRLPPNDRAPMWELAVRRFGRRQPLVRAAADIGMDLVHAQDLEQRYRDLLRAARALKQE